MHSILGQLRNKLLAGVAVAIPLLATIWVLTLGYNLVKGISAPWVKRLGIQWPGIDFAISILILLGLGVMATHVLGKRLLAAFERFLAKMPLVATIYGLAKQVMDSLRKLGSGPSFKRVVWVEYPTPGHRLLAFATGQFVEPGTGREMLAVFIPTAPNPVTGFVVVIERSRVVDAGIPMEDATKFILSAGLVPPFRGADEEEPALPGTKQAPHPSEAEATSDTRA